MSQTYRFFATTAKGIETILADELAELGIRDPRQVRAGVYFVGDLRDAYRVCLWSRVANRVLLPIASFAADSPEELYAGFRQCCWEEHFDADATFAIDANVSNSNMRHSHYAALKAKDAIADYFRDRDGTRPSVELNQPDVRINTYINRNEAEVYIDLSGESLHIRGYRTRGSDAPLKENLAAAILLRAKWQQISDQGGDFVDFMCGSGTLPIEAALIAFDIAPGSMRSYYGFLGWKQHRADLWQQLVAEASARRLAGMQKPVTILGFDHHRNTLQAAQENIKKADLGSKVRVQYQDVFQFRHDFSKRGLVVVNPPYGKRMGQDEDLLRLYSVTGKVLQRHFYGWDASVFTDSKDLARQIGIRSHKIHKLYNGAIPCFLLHFHIEENRFFHKNSLPGFLPSDQLSENSEMFRNRVIKNLRKLEKWKKKENVSCYRVYDADLPNYAVAVDLYEGERTRVHVQEYQAPASVDSEKARLRLREALTVLKETLDLHAADIFLKTRHRQRGDRQYEKLAESDDFQLVKENHCKLLVNFEDYLDTGLFLDHRPLRKMIGESCRNKSFLNLFAYTGAATVHAALGGASRTLTLDMSRTYLDWAARNLELNGIAGKQHRLVRADCLEWLKKTEEPERFDMILLDPPTFSNSKRMRSTLDVQKDHAYLIHRCMKLLSEDGILYFSTNATHFSLDESMAEEYKVKDISYQTIPPDFRRHQKIHQCWTLARRKL